MEDLIIFETGDGGDLQLLGNDINFSSGSLFNMVYLAWFGGNTEASTTGNELKTELKKDWFGNSLLFKNEQDVQFNSTLEKVLNTTVLNSAGRIKIEDAAKKDLLFLKDVAEITVDVSILDDNRVEILARLTELSNLQEKEYQILWDGLKNEVIINEVI